MGVCWGKYRRLLRLKKDDKYYFILALDHSLTVGPINGIETIEQLDYWIDFAKKYEIPGVVINAGMVEKLNEFICPEIVLQTMGLPNVGQENINRVKVANIEKVIKSDACAVSVQLDMRSIDFSKAIRVISKIVHKANLYEYPVLFMINNSDWRDVSEFNFSIRVCVELGADLIKVNLPKKNEIRNDIECISVKHPPVLMAGGTCSDAFVDDLVASKKMGFSGVCVGRNVFQGNKPSLLLQKIEQIYG